MSKTKERRLALGMYLAEDGTWWRACKTCFEILELERGFYRKAVYSMIYTTQCRACHAAQVNQSHQKKKLISKNYPAGAYV